MHAVHDNTYLHTHIHHSVMPQILSSGRLEERAQAYLLCAKCQLERPTPGQGAGNDTSSMDLETMHAAKTNLEKAIENYKVLGAYEPLMEACHLQALTCHSLGLMTERDRAADDFFEAQRLLAASQWVSVSPMSNLATCPPAALAALACES